MVTLRCLQQEPDRSLWAGEIRDIDGAQAGRVELTRRFEVEDIGSFGRSLHVPMYSVQALRELSDEELGFAAGEESCIGFAADCDAEPAAYVTATHGIYTYPLPIYDEQSVPHSYRRVGCIAAGSGFVTVLARARRRGTAVVIAILIALLVFGAACLYIACGSLPAMWEAVRNIFAK